MATLWTKFRTPQKTRTLPEIYTQGFVGWRAIRCTYAIRVATHHALAANVADSVSLGVVALDVFAAVRKLTYPRLGTEGVWWCFLKTPDKTTGTHDLSMGEGSVCVGHGGSAQPLEMQFLVYLFVYHNSAVRLGCTHVVC